MCFLCPFTLLIYLFSGISSSTSGFRRNVKYLFPNSLESRIFSRRFAVFSTLFSNFCPRDPSSHKHTAFIPNSHATDYLHRTRVYESEGDWQSKFEELCSGLRDKKWTFAELQKRLSDEKIPTEGCFTPDDVIRRVAKLATFGREKLLEEIEASNPEFATHFTKFLTSLSEEYKALNKAEKKRFVKSLRDRIERFKQVDPGLTDEAVIELAARVKARNKLNFKIPNSLCNERDESVESYKREVESLFSGYKKNYYMDEVKNELILTGVDFEDCKCDEDFINRLAYSRVFSTKSSSPVKGDVELNREVREKNRRRHFKRNSLESFFTNDLESDPFQSFFQDFYSEPGLLDGLNFNGFSIFKDLASIFGFNDAFTQQPQLQFDKHDQYDSVEDRGDEEVEEENASFIETDPNLIKLQEKTKKTGDYKLQAILNKAIMDPNLRDVLKMAATEGYNEAKEKCSGNVKALYILEKLNDKHIWS